MISEDVRNLSAELGQLADKVSPDTWDFLKIARVNLDSIADGVECLENATLKDGAV